MKERKPHGSDPSASVPAPSEPAGPDPIMRLRAAMNAERTAIQDLVRENHRLNREQQEWCHATASLVAAIQGSDPTAPPFPSRPGRSALASIADYLRELGLRAGASADHDEMMRAENATLVERCQDLMTENNNLFKLYVASRHLHSTLVFDEVLQVISEIIQDIIGASDYIVFLNDERARVMVPAIVRGLAGEEGAKVPVPVAAGSFLETAADSYTTFAPERGSLRLDRPLVVISLRNESRRIGAIAIYRLLSQKPQFTDVDYALFEFFAAHAATALFAARLFAEAEGKVKKMKEFLTLMNQG